jgi:hypothetical protein
MVHSNFDLMRVQRQENIDAFLNKTTQFKHFHAVSLNALLTLLSHLNPSFPSGIIYPSFRRKKTK